MRYELSVRLDLYVSKIVDQVTCEKEIKDGMHVTMKMGINV